MKEKAYYETINVKNEVKLRKLLETLPPFCKQFFIGIEATSSSRTKIAYAYDIGCFFDYLHATNPVCAKMDITDFPISILNEITPMDIEEYLSYLKYYEKDGTEHTNDEGGLKRKLSALRSFYHYYYKNGLIEDDPTVKVDMPKIHEKNIIRLDVDEVAKLLDEVESGENLTARQQQYHEKTKIRDLAMMTLLLGTGIRVSECVGLDMEDVDFKITALKSTAKVAQKLSYILERKSADSHGLYGGTPENHCGRRKYQCALPITSKQAHKCQIRGKYGKKIFQACNNLKTYYAA